MSINQVKSWSSSFPLFTGAYDDLDPGWYANVGVTILFYMIINILTPHANALISYFITCLKRCCDKCTCNKKKTSLRTRKDYIGLYTGPDFNVGMRYSQILTTVFVVLMYSSGIPLLYVTCFFYFVITYWIDKWLLLRLYRSPPHFDLNISKMFNIIILIAIIFHFSFGIWIYGNSQILTNSNSTFLESIADWIKRNINIGTDSFANEVLNRVTYSHNIILLLMLGLTIFFLLFIVFFVDLFMGSCCKCCDPDLDHVKDVALLDGKLYFLI
jgi:hypothetical protein